MQDTLNPNKTTSPPLRRQPGLVGGVLSGIGRTTGVSPTILRVGVALGGFVFGPTMVLAYLAAWLLIPVDKNLSSSERPSSVPTALLVIVTAIVAFQFVFGLLTSLPFSWIVVGGLAAYWLITRD